MPRVRKGAARRRAHKRTLKAVKGHRGAPGRCYRLAIQGQTRANVNARIGRKLKKRDFRGLWIIRISAACVQRGIRYSQFMFALTESDVELNRKMLAEIAVADPGAFDAVLEEVQKAVKK
ncbi:hypothetical protein LCGC14_3017890 [marine sediment metagenome]|uniref:50S ribosomal protein L20 n=1 Tax=marine sediment metagenome TaxID=412755 RepID=A0A0F8ZMA8_9ZZZZ